jgi:hypothetical protein
MARLKVFTDEGINEFRNFLVELKSNPELNKPDLSDKKYSENFEPEITVDENKIFSSRMELAEYLTKIFGDSGVKSQDVIANDKLWTWLTYLWFDQICPKEGTGRKVREIVKYICSIDYKKYYRHFIASTFRTYSTLAKENSLLFLTRPVNDHGDFIEQLASRQEIISNPNLIGVAHKLYWDNEEYKPKRGASDRKKPGNLRRLIKLFGQIELTYDIFSMNPDDIVKNLPKEFEVWKDFKN